MKINYTMYMWMLLIITSLMPSLANGQCSAFICSPTDVTIGNDAVSLICVQYDSPLAGQSTWYYEVTSGASPAISHTDFALNLGCLSIVGGTSGAGTWGPGFDDLVPGDGMPEIGFDPTTGITGIKFDEGFADNEVRNYYFVLDGNYAVEPNTVVATKAGPGFDSEVTCGPSDVCNPVCAGPCSPPSNLTVTYLTPTKAFIDWDDESCVLGYQICGYNSLGQTMCHRRPVSEKKVNNLIPGVTYNVYIRSKCDDGSMSDWSDTLTFTVPLLRLQEESSVSIYPNPANTILTVELSDELEDQILWNIYSLSGQLFKSGEVANGKRLILEVQDLPLGSYFIKIECSETTWKHFQVVR